MLSFSANRSAVIISRLVSKDIKKFKYNRYSSLINSSFHQINRKLFISSSPFSTSTTNDNKTPSEGEETTNTEKKQNQVSKIAFEDYDDYDASEPQGVTGYLTIFLRLSLLLVALGCVGLTVNELLPKRMSTNSLFSSAFEKVKMNDDVKYIVGDSGVKAFGRDMGRSEGRRNQIDNRSYKDEKDGSNRLRVRFNVQGSRGQVLVYAEISDKYLDDFVYLICQDIRTGRVVTVVDNRESIEAMNDGNRSLSMKDSVLKWFSDIFYTSSPPSPSSSSSS